MRQPRYRAAARKALRENGVTTTARRWIYGIILPNGISFPAWVVDKEIKGLGKMPNQAWLKHRDIMGIGGDHLRRLGAVITKTEFRHCEVCFRPLVGSEAIERRKALHEAGARKQPCRPQCPQDAQTGFWHRLAEAA